MSTSVLFALIGTGFTTVNDLLYRGFSRENNKMVLYSFYFFSSLFSAIIAAIICFLKFGGVKIGDSDLFFGIIIGILSFVTYLLYLLSFSGDNTSMSVTIYRMNIIPGIILAVLFLNEFLSIKKIIALIFCVTCILLFTIKRIDGFNNIKNIIYSICACITGGVLNVMNKVAIQNGASSFKLLFVRFTVVAIITGAFILISRHYFVKKEIIKYAFFSGFILLMSIFFILEALRIGEVVLVLPISQLSFVFIALISWLFLNEKMTKRKIVGFVLGIMTVVLIN